MESAPGESATQSSLECQFCGKALQNLSAKMQHEKWCWKNPKCLKRKSLAEQPEARSEAAAEAAPVVEEEPKPKRGRPSKVPKAKEPVEPQPEQEAKEPRKYGRPPGSKNKPKKPKPKKTAEEEEAQAVCREIEGENPTVIFGQREARPPKSLLPKDATVKLVPRPVKKPWRHCYEQTLLQAKTKNLHPPGGWKGLGQLPDLPITFRSVAIVGPSGSGKSTLLRNLLKERFPHYHGPLYPSSKWASGRAIIEKFEHPEQGRDLLTAMGLSTVPSWLKPYEKLSTGERYRSNLAAALARRAEHPGEPFVVDEYTSELDRDVARVISVAFSKRMSKDFGLKIPEVLAEEDETMENAMDGWDGWAGYGEEDEGVEGEVGEEGDEGEEGEDEDEGEEEEEEQQDEEEEQQDEEEQQPEDPTLSAEVEENKAPEEKQQETEAIAQAASSEEVEVVKGPYIFASCHEDVLQYLQPQFVVVCEQGQAPRVLENPLEAHLPKIRAELSGITEPLRQGQEMIGHWKPNSKIFPFRISHKNSKQPGFLRLEFEGRTFMGPEWQKGTHIEWLQDDGTGSYWGEIQAPKCQRGLGIWVKLTKVNEHEMDMEIHHPNQNVLRCKVKRRPFPAGQQCLALLENVEESMGRPVEYGDCRKDLLERAGWYMPPHFGGDNLYSGLAPEEVLLVRTIDFRPQCKLEKVDSNQRYLATYVGKPDGTLGASLENVSKLLDEPFTGLIVHRLDKLDIDPFRLLVVTGPSGSGKTALCRDMFGAGCKFEWIDGPVLGHFASLDLATEYLAAAGLDLATAMRPFSQLSGGEQARAHMARVLSLDLPVLILDEFTSLVDRPTARRMAKGLMHLIKRRRVRSKIVVVSCHSDFVQRGVLEPDFLFETHTHRLLKFRSFLHTEKLQELQEIRSSAAAELEAFQKCWQEHAGHAFFSPTYRMEVAALAGALKVLGKRELEARIKEEEAEQKKLRDVAIEDEELEPLQIVAPEISWKIPELRLVLRRALPREWAHFRKYHYKDHSLACNAVTWIASIASRACCFIAVVPESFNWIQEYVQRSHDDPDWPAGPSWLKVGYPVPLLKQRKTRRLFREHRTVTLPDFQGMGLASLVCDLLGAFHNRLGCDFTSQTVHPFYGSYRSRSPFWRALPTNQQEKGALRGNLKYSHVFLGALQEDGTEDPNLARRLRQKMLLGKFVDRCAVLQDVVPEMEEIPELS